MKIIELIKLKYPNIDKVMCWDTREDGTSWDNEYDGLMWCNEDITKPTYEELLAFQSQLQSEGYNNNKLISEYMTKLDVFIDSKAQEKGYNNSLSIITYTNSCNLTWKQEAEHFCSWRDSVWEYIFNEITKMKNNERSVPATFEDLIPELPLINWN